MLAANVRQLSADLAMMVPVRCKRIAIWNHPKSAVSLLRVGQNLTQPRTTVGESGHLGGVGPAHRFEGPLGQGGDIGLGPGDGAKDLAATGNRLDVADADFQVAFAVFAVAYEG